MENYIEQSVAGRKSAGKTALYILCSCLTAVLVLIAMIFAAGAIGDNPEKLEINWLNVVLLLICLAAAFGLFRWKDCLRMEYDYLLRGDGLEICGIFNARRRKRLASIPLDRIVQIGPAKGAAYERAQSQPGMKQHNWFADPASTIYYLIYMEERVRHMALLELNAEMLAGIRANKQLPRGAWRSEEGKSSNYASLS